MDSALIEIDEDPNHAADHAIIRVAGAAGLLATARLRIRQANGAYLGPGGWQSGEAWIDADAKEARGADLVLYVGPWLCRQMRNQTYEFTVGAVLSVETWPRITAGFSGSFGVFSPIPPAPLPAPKPEPPPVLHPLPPRPWPQPAAAPPPAKPAAAPPPEPPPPEPAPVIAPMIAPVIAPAIPRTGWKIIARRVLFALLVALLLIGAALAAIRWGGVRVAVPVPACGPGHGQDCRPPSPTPTPTPPTGAGAGAPGRQHAPDARAGTDNPEKAQIPSIARGLADRIAFQAWVMLLDDDSRRGADWWAAHRMEYWHRPQGGDWALDPGAESGAACRAAQPPASIAGCLDAIRRLTPTDRMRLHDTEYRNGWNSFPE